MRAHSSTKADDIDLMSLFGALRRNLVRLLMFSALVGGVTFAVLSLMAPRFVSEAQLAIVAKTTNPFPDGKKDSGIAPDSITPRLDKEAVNTHVRALMSPDLLLAVADDLKLRNVVEFNSALGNLDLLGGALRAIGLAGPRPGQSEQDRVLEVVLRALEVSAPRESRFINVRMAAADPQLAADFANRLADSYRAKLVTVPVQETEDVVKALEPKVEQLRRELMDSEAAVERYRAQTDQFRGGATATPVNDQRMASLNDELTKSESLRAELDSRWRTARDLMQSDSADVLPDVQKSPLIQQLINQRVRLERQVAEAQAALLPGHPRMVQLNADLTGMKRQIKAEIGKVVQSLEKDNRAAIIRVETVTRQINELKTKVVNSSGNEAQLKALESTAKSKRGELEGLQKQLEFNKTLKQTKSVPIEAQIISQARPASVPIWPKKGPWSLLASLAALILGSVCVVTRAIVVGPAPNAGGQGGRGTRNAAAPEAAYEPSLPIAVAGAATAQRVAALARKGGRAGTSVSRPKIAHVADSIIAAADGKAGYRTLLTGDTATVDTAAEAVELATTISAGGKTVVIVDWNLDGLGIARGLGVTRKPGVTDIISGDVSFEDVISRVPDTDVHFVACGDPLDALQRELDSDRLNLVLDALDEVYDHIVVTGRHTDAKELFQAIQGRFDAGVTVSELHAGSEPETDGALAFLGFEVSDMLILKHVRLSGAGASGKPRMVGSRGPRGEARP